MRLTGRMLDKRIQSDSGLHICCFIIIFSACASTVYTMADVVNKMATDARIL